MDEEDLIVYNDQDGAEKFEPKLKLHLFCPFCNKNLFSTSPGHYDCINCEHDFSKTDFSYRFGIHDYVIVSFHGAQPFTEIIPPLHASIMLQTAMPLEYWTDDITKILDKIKTFVVFQ